MSFKTIEIKDFDYHLPKEKIAKHPLAKRDSSRLLIWSNGFISEDIFSRIEEYIPEGSLVIFNNTKVIEARLFFTNEAGAGIEIFCLEPADEEINITAGMLQQERVQWKCLVGNARKWKEEKLEKKIRFDDKEFVLSAKKTAKHNDYFIIDFSWNEALSFAEVLHLAGTIPLPPYLNRKPEKQDMENYQTVYAKNNGSVAAPTAGLHFTDAVFKKLSSKNIAVDFVTLHVGAGTFKPVKTATIGEHEMHSEYFEVNISLIENLLKNNSQKIFAVGTTTLRTLESLYWMGVKVRSQMSGVRSEKQISIEDISINQWDAYENNDSSDLNDCNNISVSTALSALLGWMKENNLKTLICKTQIMIAPPYKLKVADALITNFHQPKSTLLLLIAAIAGDEWRRIYNYALAHDFRFLSYGDCCLLKP